LPHLPNFFISHSFNLRIGLRKSAPRQTNTCPTTCVRSVLLSIS
jgi:hypothetical protein